VDLLLEWRRARRAEVHGARGAQANEPTEPARG
jgi:hypothetical protein